MNRIFTTEQIDKVFTSEFYETTRTIKPVPALSADQINEIEYLNFLENIRRDLEGEQ